MRGRGELVRRRDEPLSCPLGVRIGFLSLSVEGWSLFPGWLTTGATLNNFRSSAILFYGLLYPQTSGCGGVVCEHLHVCGGKGCCQEFFTILTLLTLLKQGVLLSLEVSDLCRPVG